MANNGKTIAFRATQSMYELIQKAKERLGLTEGSEATDSDLIRIAIEDFAKNQAINSMMDDAHDNLLRINIRSTAFDYELSRLEIDFVCRLAYESINYTNPKVPKLRSSYETGLLALKAIYALLPSVRTLAAMNDHRDSIGCPNGVDLKEHIDNILAEKIPNGYFASPVLSRYVEPLSMLQDVLPQTHDLMTLNKAIKPYWSELLLMAKRAVINRQIRQGHQLLNPFSDEDRPDTRYLSATINNRSFTIEARRDAGSATFRIGGFADEIYMYLDFVKLDELWRSLRYAVETNGGYIGNIFYHKSKSGESSCRISPDKNCSSILFELSEARTMDLLSLLENTMNGHDEKMKFIISAEKTELGFV
ncbi:MAG: hypothetical protein K0U21_00290 [Proteobacteria bacterium]|nr:hypothetical protein [Pseudomonadota bacterium]